MKAFITLIIVFSGNLALASEQQRERSAIDALMNAVTNLSQTDLSCQKKSDCLALELGSKACGGPQGYFVVSKLNHNFQTIRRLAKETVLKEASYNIRYQVISDCLFLTPPQVVCKIRKCIQVPRE